MTLRRHCVRETLDLYVAKIRENLMGHRLEFTSGRSIEAEVVVYRDPLWHKNMSSSNRMKLRHPERCRTTPTQMANGVSFNRLKIAVYNVDVLAVEHAASLRTVVEKCRIVFNLNRERQRQLHRWIDVAAYHVRNRILIEMRFVVTLTRCLVMTIEHGGTCPPVRPFYVASR